jgi:rubrerythrin
MEKITTKKELKENLENMRAVEVKARKGYVEDMETFVNFKIKDTVSNIKIDEDKHIKMIDELIEMLK